MGVREGGWGVGRQGREERGGEEKRGEGDIGKGLEARNKERGRWGDEEGEMCGGEKRKEGEEKRTEGIKEVRGEMWC